MKLPRRSFLSLTLAGVLLAASPYAHAEPTRGGTLTLLLPSEPTALVTVGNVATPILSVSAKVTEGLAAWDKANPEPATTIKHMADHIDHIRKVAGIEAIGIGGDFDGMPSGPVGFEDVRGYPLLFAELARRGYSQAELEMIASRNVLRVMRAAEAYSASVADMAPIETLISPTAPE